MKLLKQYIGLVLLLATAISTNAQVNTSDFNYQKPLFDFDYYKPTFKLEGAQLANKNKSLRFSIITGYRPGVKPIGGQYGLNLEYFTDSVTGTRRVAMYNLSIVEMLAHFSVDPNKVILEVKDPSKYMYRLEYGDKETWMKKNAYCYEFMAPNASIIARTGNGVFDIFKWDLALREFFGVTVRSENDVFIVTELDFKK